MAKKNYANVCAIVGGVDTHSYDDIIDTACDAWNRLVDQPRTITSIGRREWAHIGQE